MIMAEQMEGQPGLAQIIYALDPVSFTFCLGKSRQQ
jgi:hypothetical protein